MSDENLGPDEKDLGIEGGAPAATEPVATSVDDEAAELRRIQEEFEADQVAQAADRARVDEETKARAVATESGMGRRLEIINALKDKKRELDVIDAENVRTRLADAERIYGVVADYKAELEQSQAEREGLGKRLATIEAIVAGKEEKDIARPVLERLHTAKASLAAVEAKVTEITSSIDQAESRLVPVALADEYLRLKGEQDKLDEEIETIEGFPEVRDLLYEQARNEEGERAYGYVTNAVGQKMGQGWYDQRTREVVTGIVTRYVDGVLINTGIKGPTSAEKPLETRKSEERDAIARIAQGVNFPNHNINAYDQMRSGTGDWRGRGKMEERELDMIGRGFVLKNLVGQFGTQDAVMNLLWRDPRFIQGATQSAAGKQEAKEVADVLPVYNYMLALSDADQRDQQILGNLEFRSDRVRSSIAALPGAEGGHAFICEPNGPIIPAGADDATKAEIWNAYNETKAEAQSYERKQLERDAVQTRENIRRVESDISNLEEKMVRIESLREAVKMAGQSLTEQNERNMHLTDERNDLNDTWSPGCPEDRERQLTIKLERTSGLRFGAKRTIRLDLEQAKLEVTARVGRRGMVGKEIEDGLAAAQKLGAEGNRLRQELSQSEWVGGGNVEAAIETCKANLAEYRKRLTEVEAALQSNQG